MINLCLVIHNHQPVDNDPGIIEKIYSESYLPFIRILSENPSIKAAVHYTGYLLEWLSKSHPEFIEMLRSLVKKNQIEILGGGYYEPILAVLPEDDAIGQVNKLSKLIKDLFGTFPAGAWLAERVWEPYLPEILEKSDIKYSFLDDTLFTKTGLLQSDCYNPYSIESRGHHVTVFPMLKPLRYLIPFKEPHETIAFLKESAGNGDSDKIAVFGDDGEKFGAWPETYELVYKDGWLKDFFELINSNKWIKTITPSEYLSSIGKVKHFTYLPTGSYDEMMEWSLIHKEDNNVDDKGRTVGAGFWRLFLSKYVESRRMYLRMLTLSKMVNQHTSVKNKVDKSQIIDELWKSQFNDVYWHGVFGGIYLSELRAVAYKHLITAQSMLESRVKDSNYIEITKLPKVIESDDYLINSDSLYVSLSSENGGAITEIDFKPKSLNITDTITRKAEPYHSELISLKQENLQISSITGRQSSSKMNFSELLVYDKYPKFSFMDYLLNSDITINEFQTQHFKEIVSLADKKYDVDNNPQELDGKIIISLTRRELLQNAASLLIKKTLHMEKNSSSINMVYEITYNSSAKDINNQYTFATELNFGALSDPKVLGSFNQPSDKPNIDSIIIEYEKLGMNISISLNKNVDVWILPVNTVSKSEAGFENKLQGISVIPHWQVSSNAESEPLEIKVSVTQTNPTS